MQNILSHQKTSAQCQVVAIVFHSNAAKLCSILSEWQHSIKSPMRRFCSPSNKSPFSRVKLSSFLDFIESSEFTGDRTSFILLTSIMRHCMIGPFQYVPTSLRSKQRFKVHPARMNGVQFSVSFSSKTPRKGKKRDFDYLCQIHHFCQSLVFPRITNLCRPLSSTNLFRALQTD